MFGGRTPVDLGPGITSYEDDPFVRHTRWCLLCQSWGGQRQCEVRKAMERDFERNGWEGKKHGE